MARLIPARFLKSITWLFAHFLCLLGKENCQQQMKDKVRMYILSLGTSLFPALFHKSFERITSILKPSIKSAIVD